MEVFVQLSSSTNYVCSTGTRISGSGSTIQNFLAPPPDIQPCLSSDPVSTALLHWPNQGRTEVR